MKITRRLGATLAATTLVAGVGMASVTTDHAAAAKSSRCGYTSAQPMLAYGSSGTAVEQLQCELRMSVRSVTIAVDGQFGPATQAAVRKLQACAHLSVDGVAGPNTWSVANYWTSSPSFVC